MQGQLFGFLFLMWVLMLIGGGIAVVILGPISISGFGEYDGFVSSATKGLIANWLVSNLGINFKQNEKFDI